MVSSLKEIGFDGVCTIEEFRPEYYAMSHEENVKKEYHLSILITMIIQKVLENMMKMIIKSRTIQ